MAPEHDELIYPTYLNLAAPPEELAVGRGMTLASFVQQVLYAIYKVRLDTTYAIEPSDAFHADTDRFKEVLMEANFVIQELQKEQDWNWLRERWNIGTAASVDIEDGGIAEFDIPSYVYKVCTGFNDAVRLRSTTDPMAFIEVPFTSPRSGQTINVAAFDAYGRSEVYDLRLAAFVVGNVLTFNRPFTTGELGLAIETDVIALMEPLHICHTGCTQPCPQAYQDKVFTQIPDPYYMVVRTAARRAEGDPSVSDRVMSLQDEASKILSAMRENDSSKTIPDTYAKTELGYLRVL